jgi:hypothetical protein
MRALQVPAVVLAFATLPTVPQTSFIVFDLAGDGIALSRTAAGVSFDLDADGAPEQIAWTTRDSDDAILAMDSNGNGTIDNGREVLGQQFRLSGPWSATFGVDALIHEFQGFRRGGPIPPDANRLDRRDPYFIQLLLWGDRNHDGRSSPSELHPLATVHVTAINTGFLRFKSGAERAVDASGNVRLFEGHFLLEQRGVEFKRALAEYRIGY